MPTSSCPFSPAKATLTRSSATMVLNLHRKNSSLNERTICLTHSSQLSTCKLASRGFQPRLLEFRSGCHRRTRSIRQAVVDHLGIYRCTSPATTGIAPDLLLHGRPPRTHLDGFGHPSPSSYSLGNNTSSDAPTHARCNKTAGITPRKTVTVGDFARVKSLQWHLKVTPPIVIHVE